MPKRRLGRGLSALLGTEEGGFEPASLESAELVHLAVDQIDANPYQPRRQFDPAEIAALADSLRQHGMLQPIIVRMVGDRYQLVAGERRLRASVEAHLHEIPARVMELDDQRVFELAMVENLQRQDLDALEKARAFRTYLSRYGGTQEELADRLGLQRPTLTNLIRLLDLPDEIQDSIRREEVSAGHARALLALDDGEERIVAFRRIVAEKLTVRQTEVLVKTGEPSAARPRLRRDPAHATTERAPHVLDLESRLRERIGLPVALRSKGGDKGQVVIDYASREDLDRLAHLLG